MTISCDAFYNKQIILTIQGVQYSKSCATVFGVIGRISLELKTRDARKHAMCKQAKAIINFAMGKDSVRVFEEHKRAVCRMSRATINCVMAVGQDLRVFKHAIEGLE